MRSRTRGKAERTEARRREEARPPRRREVQRGEGQREALVSREDQGRRLPGGATTRRGPRGDGRVGGDGEPGSLEEELRRGAWRRSRGEAAARDRDRSRAQGENH